MGYQHIFGPVLSRRLGVSLGVDLVTHKVCSLDCVYCECGRTTDLTMTRREYVPFEAVRLELDHYWAHNDDPDYITFSGSGEPTLNSALGRVIRYIKEQKPEIRVAVLTNATLLDLPEVRQELAGADLVVPSLDAVSGRVFRRINRPGAGLSPKDVIAGIESFAGEFKGEIWLELFVLPGVNDDPEELLQLKQAIQKIKPHRTQLNTLDRPGTLANLRPATQEEMDRVIAHLDLDNVEVIAKVKPGRTGRRSEDLETAVLEAVHRRPCTPEDLAGMFSVDPGKMAALLTNLEARGCLESGQEARGTFFRTVKPEHP